MGPIRGIPGIQTIAHIDLCVHFSTYVSPSDG